MFLFFFYGFIALWCILNLIIVDKAIHFQLLIFGASYVNRLQISEASLRLIDCWRSSLWKGFIQCYICWSSRQARAIALGQSKFARGSTTVRNCLSTIICIEIVWHFYNLQSRADLLTILHFQHWWGIQIPVLTLSWTFSIHFELLQARVRSEVSWRYCRSIILFFTTGFFLVADVTNYLSCNSISWLCCTFSLLN